MNAFFAGIKDAYEELKGDSSIPRLEDDPYDNEENQKVDVWGTVNEKLLIFVHGGYWAAGTRKDCLPPAKCVLAHGFAFASVGYGLSTEGRTIDETAEDVVRGVKFLLNKYLSARTVIVGGHSAGAHLAVQAVVRLRDERIRGLLLYSGCYFLKELVTSEIGTDISLTPEQATRNSCDLSLMNGLSLKTLVVLGLQEAPKLIEQNREFVKQRKEAIIAEFPSGSHYTIITNMMSASSGESLTVARFLNDF
ncbi:unnamed protein product [Caenorhabditis sp. 36 PRJEB53466]|nr:unnamed protein product [Caenorhabditis sp. 36 PRJEB53466]